MIRDDFDREIVSAPKIAKEVRPECGSFPDCPSKELWANGSILICRMCPIYKRLKK
jgi:hypothetical protein